MFRSKDLIEVHWLSSEPYPTYALFIRPLSASLGYQRFRMSHYQSKYSHKIQRSKFVELAYIIKIFHLIPVFKDPSHLTEDLLLLCALDLMSKAHSVLCVKFHTNLSKVRSSTIKSTSFDARHIRHDFQFSVQRAAAGRTEEMFVNLSGGANSVVRLESSNERSIALCDLEGGARYNDVRGVGST
jgi:hypothetical protein